MNKIVENIHRHIYKEKIFSLWIFFIGFSIFTPNTAGKKMLMQLQQLSRKFKPKRETNP